MQDTVEVGSTGESVDYDDVTVDGTSGGITILAANPGRKSALIINTGEYSMRVTTDGSAPTATHGKLVASGAALSLASPFCPTLAVKGIRSTANSTTANASEIS